MFPIGDDNRDRVRTPFINYLLIGLNILVFVLFQGLGENLAFTYAWSTVPAEIVTGKDYVTPDRRAEDPYSGQLYLLPGLQPTPISVYLTLLTSMFMHGSLAHIFGNMLYLWIFGDNLENLLGHVRYLIFYLLTGLLASLAHVFSTIVLSGTAEALIPSLGASGAISGVLGGYLLMFPQRRVRVIFLRVVTDVPAIVAVGLWFAFQVVESLGVLGGGGGGVAYAAHIGGFIAGLALIKIFALGVQPPRPPAPTFYSRY
jgi:membrane associated rhomboid family serine protease